MDLYVALYHASLSNLYKRTAEIPTALRGIRTRAEKILVYLSMEDQYLNH